MAIKAILADIGEVDEKYRDLYTQKGDKWELTGVEGIKTQADIDRLNGSLTKERTDHAKTKADFKTATDKLAAWEDMDPEDIKTKLEKLGTFEAAGAPEITKNFSAVVAAEVAKVVDGRVKSETNKLQRQLDEANNKLGTLSTENQTFKQREDTRTVHDGIRAAAVAAKVLPEAIPDLLLVAGQELKLTDGKVLTEDGRDPVQVIEDYKAKRPYFWPAAKGAGGQGGGQGGDLTGENPFKREGWNQTKIAQLVQKDPAKAARLAEAAGVPKDANGNLKYHVMPPAPSK